MGNIESNQQHNSSCISGISESNKDFIRAVPRHTYVEFPKKTRTSDSILLSSFQAIPKTNIPNTHRNYAELFWWTDCHFVPHNDSQLILCSAVYYVGQNGTLNTSVNLPRSKICLFHLNYPTIKCESFSTASVFKNMCPKIQVFGDGKQVSYIGMGEIKVISVEKNVSFTSRALDVGFSVYKNHSLSPDGKIFAIMSCTNRKVFELCIFHVNAISHAEFRFDCSKANSAFKASFGCPERVEIHWSPDSTCLAMSIEPHGQLIVLSIRLRKCVRNVFPDLIPDGFLGGNNTYAFHPHSNRQQFMAIGTNDRRLYIVNINTGWILAQTSQHISGYGINALCYSPVGDKLCVALHNYDVHLYNSTDLSLVISFNMCSLYVDANMELNTDFSGTHPMVTSMCISQSGEQLATATNNGHVQIWKLPKILSLQHMCRMYILKRVPLEFIKDLPLPSKVVDYLINIECMY